MPSYEKNAMISLVRLRQNMKQEYVMDHTAVSDGLGGTMSRYENNRQEPRMKVFKGLMETMRMPIEAFFCPHFEDQPMEVVVQRPYILNLLDIAEDNISALHEAKHKVAELASTKGFDAGLNKQFILSCQAWLNELLQKDPDDTVILVKEGMAITYKDFDEKTFEGDGLILEEPRLLITLTSAYHRKGDTAEAIELLKRVQRGIERLPKDDHEKDKQLAPLMLTLLKYLLQDSQYEEALEACIQGIDVSIRRNRGRYAPDFAYYKALCLHNLGKADECRKQLILAHSGYILLHEVEKAERVKVKAKEFGLDFNTYGVETLPFSKPDYNLKFGEVPDRTNIGNMLRFMHEQTGMSLEALCQGICSKSNFSKLIIGKIGAHVHLLEPIMQRMGRDINLYANTFLSGNDFKEKQMRDEVNISIVTRKYESAAKLLADLEKRKAYQKGANLQFVKSSWATITASKDGNTHDYFNMLKEAMSVTMPGFNEMDVSNYRFSYHEIILVNKLGIYYCETDALERGLRLFERLIESMDKFYVDETEKIRTYTMVLYNYSNFLEHMGRNKEALQIAKKGMLLDIKHKRLTLLPGFADNIGCALYNMGEKKESVPYFALACRGAELLGRIDNQQATANFVREHLDITFD